MGKTAFLFPGQGRGSIKLGMGKDLYDHSPEARDLIWQADHWLGRPLSHVCFWGPESDLLKTLNSQLASLVITSAYLTAGRDAGDDFEFHPEKTNALYTAGFSVGYWAELVFNGVVPIELAVQLVLFRAQLMTDACQNYPGQMVLLRNPKIPEIEELCTKIGGCNIGLYNSPEQVVLSGRVGSVNKAVEEVNRLGLVDKVTPAGTEGAFHSECMEPVLAPFSRRLEEVEFKDPARPMVANSDTRLITKGEDARREAIQHIVAPVRWIDTLGVLKDHGVTDFHEVGHGETLGDIARKVLYGVGGITIVSGGTALVTYLANRAVRRR